MNGEHPDCVPLSKAAISGPGAVFWMWCTALVSMATKYAEAVLAVKYRETDEEGNHVGGPMYYIKNGLVISGSGWRWPSLSLVQSPVLESVTWCRPTRLLMQSTRTWEYPG